MMWGGLRPELVPGGDLGGDGGDDVVDLPDSWCEIRIEPDALGCWRIFEASCRQGDDDLSFIACKHGSPCRRPSIPLAKAVPDTSLFAQLEDSSGACRFEDFACILVGNSHQAPDWGPERVELTPETTGQCTRWIETSILNCSDS